MSVLLSTLSLLMLTFAARADEDDYLRLAQEAWMKGDKAAALKLAGKAIDKDPKNARLYFIRGQMREDLGQHAPAIKDFDDCVQIDASFAEAYDHRGSERFKLGKIKESLADFDSYLRLRPDAAKGHWKRGISLFYAGRYAEGRQQFNAYEDVDTNDVENAVWHFLCNARATNLEQARKQILKIGKDTRTPMMEVYALFKGDLKPADVLAAANAGKVPAGQRKGQLYAHLYLGLYYDILGDKKQALENLALAANKYRISHYMGEVAAVHEQMLRR